MDNNELFERYSEENSLKYIRNALPQELKERFSDDDILYLLDLMDEFYENKTEKRADESEDDDDNELIEFIITNAKEDSVGDYTPDEIMFVLNGELEYCEAIPII